MSYLTIKVCEECGRQSANGDNWLVVSKVDIKSAGTEESLINSDKDLDLCSQGCLLRYIAKHLEQAANGSAQARRAASAERLRGGDELGATYLHVR